MNAAQDVQSPAGTPHADEEGDTMPLASAEALPRFSQPPVSALPPIIQENIAALWAEKIATGASPPATLKGTAVSHLTFTPPRRRVAGTDAKATGCDYRLAV